MKTVVCFGDSNTWGYMPSGEGRYPFKNRWTSVLQEKLGNEFFVIPEGLNGRTTVFEDPVEGDKCGLTHLVTILESHKPIDLILIMLGTNDLKSRFGLNAYEIAQGAERLVKLVKKSDAGVGGNAPEIILVSPPPILKSIFLCFDEQSVKKSHDLSGYYAEVAKVNKIYFLDAGDIVKSSTVDGIHWEKEEHEKFGETVAGKIKEIMGK
ncbi:MAG: hydrolase [Spirochaetes bacterium]|nr:MAG: hydrolase [Spirochaetota bacterium]RKX99576.1 MAG: hydrolase [Spirochaetota bacterium]